MCYDQRDLKLEAIEVGLELQNNEDRDPQIMYEIFQSSLLRSLLGVTLGSGLGARLPDR